MNDVKRIVICKSTGIEELEYVRQRKPDNNGFFEDYKRLLLSALEQLPELEVGQRYVVRSVYRADIKSWDLPRFRLEGLDRPVPAFLFDEVKPVSRDTRLKNMEKMYPEMYEDAPELFVSVYTAREYPCNADMIYYLLDNDDVREYVWKEMQADKWHW